MKRNKILRDELKNNIPHNDCCILTALKISFRLYGNLHLKNKKYVLEFRKKNLSLLRRIIKLFNTIFSKTIPREINYNEKEYWVLIDISQQILKKLDIISENEGFLPDIKLKNFCCKKSFIKEIILYKGYLFDFEDSYQLEVRIEGYLKKLLQKNFDEFNIKHYDYDNRIFVKGFKNLKKLFFILGLKESLKKMIEFYSYRENKNKSVVLTNYNIANLTRQVNSFEKYKKIIEKIDKEIGIDNLSDKLREIAYVRLHNPDSSYKELGEKLEDSLSKGGVQSRLRKLKEIYEDL